ncbi:MAG: Uma2 family endonuclease [Ktedonobacteraceae bacterium]
MTVEEWRELERTSHDIKHEYIDGRVYAMTGGSLSHARIGMNVIRTIDDALAATDKPYYVYSTDVATRLSPKRYTYPDVLVSCNEQDRPTTDKTEVEFPHVIVEVLSDSTEAKDRGWKFALYRACPTVQEYVLVATKYQAVEVHRRTSRGWTDSQYYEPGDEIELTSLDIHFPMTALYRNAGVPEAMDEPDGEV